MQTLDKAQMLCAKYQLCLTSVGHAFVIIPRQYLAGQSDPLR